MHDIFPLAGLSDPKTVKLPKNSPAGSIVYCPGCRVTESVYQAEGDADLLRARRAAVKTLQLANLGIEKEKVVALAVESLDLSRRRDLSCFWFAMLALLYAEETGLVEDELFRRALGPIWEKSQLHRGVLLLVRARARALTGGLPTAQGLFTRSLRAPLPPRLSEVCIAWQVENLVEMGRVDEARDLLREHGYFEPGKVIDDYPVLMAALGALELAAGRYEQSLNCFLICGKQLSDHAVYNPAVIRWRSPASECSSALRRRHLALHLAQEDVAAAKSWGSPWSAGMAFHALAVSQTDENTTQSFWAAAALLRESRIQRGQAKFYYDFATHLSEQNRLGEAGEMFKSSEYRAQVVDNSLWVERAARGVQRVKSTRSRQSLTKEEKGIATLARLGLTNAEIARRSHVTVSTVEQHLSNVYRKLRISQRGDLAYAMLPPCDWE
ncbi:response regulator transcription factor [Streptomyces mirabilis]|uniref:helix-turn-helix transcriptional regulator n=1 Tax=Streptomyces mirabilis TaxID=68239 RepID=UPI00340E0896